MCGIVVEAGAATHVPADSINIKIMADAIAHRGPDGDGYCSHSYDGWRVNMGHRRLAVLDIARGAQPMTRGSTTVVYNGEIYNHRRIRRNLEEVGAEFITECDTEVLAYLWDREGVGCLPGLAGMFAFAVWDDTARTLHAVRDRIGKKPLYYWYDEHHGLLVVASEIKAILAHPLFRKQPDHEALSHYLCLQYVPEPATAFAGIRSVPAGGRLTFKPDTGRLSITQWHEWTPTPYQGGAAEAVRKSVQNAVASRLESDVPIGVYLSGGIDSTIIATVAARSGMATGPLHTFSMGFREQSYNELPIARQTAERLGTVHHEFITDLPQLREVAAAIVTQYDQPFGDCSAIPTMLLTAASKRHITVALSGDGGDEAFGGYARYWCADPARGTAAYTRWMMPLPVAVRNHIMDDKFKAMVADVPHPGAWLYKHAINAPVEGERNRWMWMDTMTYLPNDIIVKMERASMAASVEVRCPFLDHDVVELGMAIPDTEKIVGGTGKIVLREAFRDELPMHVVVQPKRGFSVPVSEWFRAETGVDMLTAMLTDPDFGWGLLDPARVAARVDAHWLRRADIGHELWIVLMLHLWMKEHFG